MPLPGSPFARQIKQQSALVCGIVMPIKPDRASIDRPGGDATHRPHLVPRASPCLEVLEPRYLMSRLQVMGVANEPVPRPTSIVHPNLAHSSSEISVKAGDDARYAALSSGGVVTGTGPGDSQEPSYVIVYETDAPHSSLASAQDLPDVPNFGVIGALDSGELIDLFRMHIGTGTAGLQFELDVTSGQSSPLVPLRFMLFDETGRVVGSWTTGDAPGGLPITLKLDGGPAGATLYLGISGTIPNGPGGTPSTVDYQLWVARLAAPDRPPTFTGASPPVPPSVSPLSSAPLQPVTVLSSGGIASPKGDAQPPPAPILNVPGAGARLAVGSVPALSAGPIGGAIADHDPTTASDQLSASVKLGWVDRPLETPALNPGEMVGPAALFGRGSDARALVALRGPGGFPLLEAAAIGNWRRVPTVVSGNSAGPATSDGADPLTTDMLAGLGLPSRADVPPVNAVAPHASTWGGFQVSLPSSLNSATALTLNVVLSGPLAGFDYLAIRFDSDNRESHQRRTDQKRRSALDSRGGGRHRSRSE